MLRSIHSDQDVPTISFAVVVPLFNKAPHICRALDSAVSQTYPPQEIIVVDDGSTDGGDNLVTQYSKHEVRLLRRAKPGAGGYAARNLGIKSARFDWIAFLDADDEWLPTHLANLLQSILSADKPEELVGVFAGYFSAYRTGYRHVDSFTALMGERSNSTLSFDGFLRIWIKLGKCPVWTSASAFRRSALIEAGLFPEERARRGGDKDTWLRVCSLGPIRAASGVTAIYHKDSVNMVTRTTHTNLHHCMVESVEALAKLSPEHTRALLFRMINDEMFRYGLLAAQHGPLSRENYRSFRVSINPLKFCILLTASTRVGAASLRVAKHIRDWNSRITTV
jgi:glycosyltransferase involved in cell wall biosynthesis